MTPPNPPLPDTGAADGNRRLRLNTAWLMLGQLARLGLQAAYFLLAARALGPADFGVFVAVVAVSSALAPFAGWGLGSILVLRTARSAPEFADAAWRFLAVLAATAPVLLLAQLAISRLTSPNTSLVFVASIAAAELIAFRVTEVSGQAFQAHERLRGTALVIVTAAAARFAAAALFSIIGGELVAWGGWYLAANVVAATISATLAVRAFGTPSHQRGSAWQLGLGTFFALGTGAKAIYTDVDKAILLRLAGDATAGTYGAAYRVVTVAFAPVLALLGAASARLFRGGSSGVRGSLAAVGTILPAALVLGTLSSVGLWMGAPVMPWLLGPDFAEASAVVRWLAPLPLAMVLHHVFAEALAAAGQQAWRTGVQMVAAVGNGVANLLLVGTYGWQAAATISVATELALGLSLGLLAWRMTAKGG